MPGARVNPYSDSGSHEIHANNVSMFRASPWVTYEPTTNQSQPTTNSDQMDQDVDMDAPQISTLREEDSPPPPTKLSATGRRGKSSHKPPPVWPRPRRKEVQTDEDLEVDDEPEEDQLIDDDDELAKPPPAPTPPNPSRSGEASKRKAPSKRKPRKSEKKLTEGEKKALDKVAPNPDIVSTVPMASSLETPPSEHLDDSAQSDIKQAGSSTPAGSDAGRSGTPKKQKKPAAPRPKNQPTKLKTIVPILADDTGGMSEGYTGTAASSPVTAQFEANTPDAEPEALGILSAVALAEETNLENVPLPQYPLPTKPFPVQPPHKMVTGFAPTNPLDKSGKKVRHWRVAQREVRGIAGGRWFTRSWVGDKESEYASSIPKNVEASGASVLRLGATSLSVPVTGKGSGKAKSKAMSSLVASAAPSRSGSSIPEAPPANARPPTKMRMIIAPPSEAGDSDMAILPES